MLSIDSLVDKGNTEVYLFSNADGKCWLVPASGLATALQLYQPSGVKGRLLKRFFPYLHTIGFVRSLMHASKQTVSLRSDIAAIAGNVFNTSDFSFSIFGGTPSVHQKATIQFFKGNHIFGYGKISDSEEVWNLFRHEKSLLESLRHTGVKAIPKCLYCAEIAHRQYFFIQSTVKTEKSESPGEWTELHENFLRQMYEKTRKPVLFEESDFYRSLSGLKTAVGLLPQKFGCVIEPELDKILSRLRGCEYDYSAFHADFTPWNMFVEKGELFVFDWEYGQLTYPPMLDRYHFVIQQAMLVDHLSAHEIYERIKRMPWFISDELDYYLLDIISRFVLREKGNISESLKQMLNTWCGLLGR